MLELDDWKHFADLRVDSMSIETFPLFMRFRLGLWETSTRFGFGDCGGTVVIYQVCQVDIMPQLIESKLNEEVGLPSCISTGSGVVSDTQPFSSLHGPPFASLPHPCGNCHCVEEFDM